MDKKQATEFVANARAINDTENVKKWLVRATLDDALVLIDDLIQQLADYKEGCEGLKMSVGDLRDERDSLEQRLAAARAAVEKADTQWEPHNCRDVHPAYFKAALEILQKGGG